MFPSISLTLPAASYGDSRYGRKQMIVFLFFEGGGTKMPINKSELTKEQIQKAMSCETVEELMELAKSEGIELTKEEAEAYLAEMEDVELDEEALKQVAGGGLYGDCSAKECVTKDFDQCFSYKCHLKGMPR